ncbi:germin-like protein subfamily 3 member 4 [Amaranthus tricolor]|uniref:germin-like protein subfamily 3 member 4 n=1 Tax=Amaranthus tricolor TaxID=29722 RepID=UPI00258E8650|nr:germin-like protein subfamily 3 member 4 [Amaranthus tricolor]
MFNSWPIISYILLISFKFCLADNQNLQDFCPAASTSSNNLNTPIFINGFPCKNPANVTASDFKTSILKSAGDTDNFLLSSVNIVTAAEFSGLNTLGLGLARTDLEIDGMVTLHSHPRAAEMLFVSKGVVTVGFIDTRNNVFQKILKDGDVFIIPKGMIHFCYNTGFESAKIFSVLNSQNPGLIDLSGHIFGSNSEAAANMKKRIIPSFQTKADCHTYRITSDQHTEL